MITSNLVVLPSIISLVVLCLLLASWRMPSAQKILHCLGLVSLCLASFWLVYQVFEHHYLTLTLGGWPAPFGITFVADGLASAMLAATTVVALCCGLYALTDIDSQQFKAGFLFAYWVLLLGICGAILTGDLFNLYVWFEVMLIGSFALLGLGKPSFWLYNKFKYVALNLIGTFIMLAAIGLMYGLSGTLDMADFSMFVMTQGSSVSGSLLGVVLMFFVAVAIKSALFPVFAWLPAAYHSTSYTASSFMGGVLTKVAIYVIIRLFYTIYPVHSSFISHLLLILAAITMVVGVIGAAAQYNYRRILSFHIISQIGYMLLGIGLFTPLALAACLFFVVHNIITKTVLFLTSGIANRITNQQDVRYMGGLYGQFPKASWLFLIAALSLAGLPPLSGFWGKFLLIKAAVVEHQVLLTVVAISVSLLTLYSMIKIWNFAYWQDPDKEQAGPYPKLTGLSGLVAPTALGVVALLVLSLCPQPFYHFFAMSAQQLMHPATYISAVLGDGL